MNSPTKKTMRIRIDEGMGTLGDITGIGSHSIELARALRWHAECTLSNYSLLRVVPRVLRRMIYMIIANVREIITRCDITHFHNFYVPFLRGHAKKVTTIHDLASFSFPETLPKLYRQYAQKTITRSIRRADMVTTPSESVRTELLRQFPELPAENVRYCAHGLRNVFFSLVAREDLLPRDVQPMSYVLFVGTLEKRKNVEFLVRYFVEAKRNHGFDKGLSLLLVGRPGFGFDQIKKCIGSASDVRCLGRVEDQTLVALYRYARAFIFPSLCEGMGLPVIEAMTQKIPIIASKIGTNVELNNRHNRQFLLFDPNNGEEFIQSLKSLEANGTTLRDRIDYGDLTPYSYEKVGAAHFSLYETLLQSKIKGDL